MHMYVLHSYVSRAFSEKKLNHLHFSIIYSIRIFTQSTTFTEYKKQECVDEVRVSPCEKQTLSAVIPFDSLEFLVISIKTLLKALLLSLYIMSFLFVQPDIFIYFRQSYVVLFLSLWKLCLNMLRILTRVLNLHISTKYTRIQAMYLSGVAWVKSFLRSSQCWWWWSNPTPSLLTK